MVLISFKFDFAQKQKYCPLYQKHLSQYLYAQLADFIWQ